jgi:hypothetical protein
VGKEFDEMVRVDWRDVCCCLMALVYMVDVENGVC